MSSFEIVNVTDKKVICNGGTNLLGHPNIYLNIGDKEEITCPYCSKKFVFIKKSK